MHRHIFAILALSFGTSTVHADSLIDFETYRCIQDFAFFEYTKVDIYNEDTKPEAHGYQRPYKGEYECKLDDQASVQVTPDDLTIVFKGTKVFSGPKHLSVVRVQSGESSHAELCFLPSQINTSMHLFKANGGCIFSGLEGLRVNGPHTPSEVADLLRKQSAP